MPADRGRPRVLILGCGALARELRDTIEHIELAELHVECLPARLHNRPEQIPGAVERRLRKALDSYDRIFVAYADCGTGGKLDEVLDRYQVERLAGAHCYEFYAGAARFRTLHAEEAGTLYLTDYLVRNFNRLIWKGLGLDRHPELFNDYFGNYRRAVHLAQTTDAVLAAEARAAADLLGLDLEYCYVGSGALEAALVSQAESAGDRLAAT